MVEVEVKAWGNSFGVILPKEKLKKFGLKKGDKIEIEIIMKKKIDGFGIAKKAELFEEEKEEHREFW